MLGSSAYLMKSHVWHARMQPAHAFAYHVYYLAFNPRASHQLNVGPLRVNRRAVLSYHDADHGLRDGSPASAWAEQVFVQAGISTKNKALVLITMPRVCGYVFNPVSFWLLLESASSICAVIAEVNNTFGETHSYVLAHDDGRAIAPEDILVASKHFHVSPFMKIEGDYHFSFALGEQSARIRIDHVNGAGEVTLKTTLSGKFLPLVSRSAWRMFFAFPLVTLKVIALIHYQAVCLMLKKVRYIRKPNPPIHEVTKWRS